MTRKKGAKSKLTNWPILMFGFFPPSLAEDLAKKSHPGAKKAAKISRNLQELNQKAFKTNIISFSSNTFIFSDTNFTD